MFAVSILGNFDRDISYAFERELLPIGAVAIVRLFPFSFGRFPSGKQVRSVFISFVRQFPSISRVSGRIISKTVSGST